MKKLLFFVVALTLFMACENSGSNDNEKNVKQCPIVKADAVPSLVISAFQTKYPGVTVDKWFNKDSMGYCALFIINNQKTLSQFNNDGSIVKEETDLEQEGEHQDNADDNDSGCECETGD